VDIKLVAMSDIKSILTNQEGFIIHENYIPLLQIESLQNRVTELYPIRAVSSKNEYKENDEIKHLEDICVWWSQSLEKFNELKPIKQLVDNTIQQNFPTLVNYINDIVVINPNSRWINPHVDTPYRFDKWNKDSNLLGIQCIIPLTDVSEENGSTGIVPYSQKRNFEIKKCYEGTYNNWFLDNKIQPILSKGSLLMYNSRVLHSSMPNKTNIARYALLMNYIESSILNEVKTIDNVWKSNGKHT
jgi:ectoine hydroxylase-related dioxygenase (phytanoyl-CoA dioxygenase family)